MQVWSCAASGSARHVHVPLQVHTTSSQQHSPNLVKDVAHGLAVRWLLHQILAGGSTTHWLVSARRSRACKHCNHAQHRNYACLRASRAQLQEHERGAFGSCQIRLAFRTVHVWLYRHEEDAARTQKAQRVPKFHCCCCCATPSGEPVADS